MNIVFFVIALCISFSAFATSDTPEMSSENGYVEPFQMFDNVYYVGDKWVSSYAVVTSSGLVIIDTLDFPYSKWIPVNLKKLGLDDKKVSHIIVTHGHSDHVGGAQYLQSLYGSEVVMTEKGFELAQKQSRKSSEKNKFLPPTVKSFAEDSSRLIVGDTRFDLYITPGHTEGDLSINFMVEYKGQPHRAFVVGGHGLNFEGLDRAKMFVGSMSRIRELAMKEPRVAVNLSNHPHKSSLFEKREQWMDNDAVNPFIDSEGFFRFLEDLEVRGNNKLEQEMK